MWLSKVVSIILIHIIFINICVANDLEEENFNFDRAQFVAIGKEDSEYGFLYIQQGLLIHPQAVITVADDLLYEAESLKIRTGLSQMSHYSKVAIAENVNVINVIELPETSKIVLLILEEEILGVKLINYKHTSYDDQYNGCKLIKLGFRQLHVDFDEVYASLTTKEKNTQLLSHMTDKGCPSKLNKIVDFKSSLFTDYVYCIKEIKKKNCRRNYPGASLVCRDHETNEFYLAGLVIGKSHCNWMLINTPKLHASIEAHLKTIQ
ncbi:uncharacterized protein LOC130673568 [Microplitis mediator]|uniref:uncharacterized protein LOC130673568 n=1 Tax=Microplitis mediator TaxID=375433 RepID=UPI002554DF35|nr:uncharacterized protein LOC130673568 [Microplitis mediator]